MREIFKVGDSLAAKFSKCSHFNSRAGTSYKTRMQSTYRALQDHAKKARWGKDVTPLNITEKQIKGFIQSRIDAGLGERTIQNEMSHIRRSLEGVGRKEFAQVTCSNKNIGIPSASRIGTGKVVNQDVFQAAREKLAPETRSLVDLQWSLGLRVREAVCAGPSLNTWLKTLETGGSVLHVTDGTKGGRVRDIYIRPDNVAAAKSSIIGCLSIFKDIGKLVDSPHLKAALETHTDRLARTGLKGDNSSHSLRRDFAYRQYKYYLKEGYDDKKSLQLVSRDMGHGDGRGRWVYNNYIRATLEAESK